MHFRVGAQFGNITADVRFYRELTGLRSQFVTLEIIHMMLAKRLCAPTWRCGHNL